jgi:hypothetical protein
MAEDRSQRSEIRGQKSELNLTPDLLTSDLYSTNGKKHLSVQKNSQKRLALYKKWNQINV